MAGDSVTPNKTSGEFSVPANLETGVPFSNQFGREVSISFSASGTWQFEPSIPANGPNGDPNHPMQNMKYPDYPSACLLAINEGNDPPSVYLAGSQTRLTLPADATLYFKMNDSEGGYYNNLGNLTVSWHI